MVTVAVFTLLICLLLLVLSGVRWLAVGVVVLLYAFFPRFFLLFLFAFVGIRVLASLLKKETKP